MNDLDLYFKYRPQMKTGDLLTYNTRGVVSSMIKWWSPGSNHAGMVLDLDEYSGDVYRRWTLEATSHGPRMVFLSGLLAGLHGECYWHQLNPEITKVQRNIAGAWALEQQGVVEYDLWGILQYPFKLVSADLNRLWCSEYVQFSWAKGGIIAMGPEDLAAKPSDLPKFGVTLPPILIVRSKPEAPPTSYIPALVNT